jgi:hypothetical protein
MTNHPSSRLSDLRRRTRARRTRVHGRDENLDHGAATNTRRGPDHGRPAVLDELIEAVELGLTPLPVRRRGRSRRRTCVDPNPSRHHPSSSTDKQNVDERRTVPSVAPYTMPRASVACHLSWRPCRARRRIRRETKRRTHTSHTRVVRAWASPSCLACRRWCQQGWSIRCRGQRDRAASMIARPHALDRPASRRSADRAQP